MKKVITAIALGLSMNASAGPLERSVATDSICAGVFDGYSKIVATNSDQAEQWSFALKISAVTKAQRWLGLSGDAAIKTVNRQVEKTSQTTRREYHASTDNAAGRAYITSKVMSCESALKDALLVVR